MSNENVEQENEYEVVDLTGGDAPEQAEEVYASKYEMYAAKAEKEAAEAAAASEANDPEPTESASVPDESPEVPEKFQGKSKEEIIESYMQLESEFGRRGIRGWLNGYSLRPKMTGEPPEAN